jgi:hypothetical protein
MAGKQTMLTWILIGLTVLGACAPEPPTPRVPDYVTLTPLPSLQPSEPARVPPLEEPPTPFRSLESACEPDPSQQGVRYEIAAGLDWATFALHVRESVVYRNESGGVQNTLVFNVENNVEPNSFALERVSDPSGAIGRYTLEGQLLTVPLANPLPPDCEMEFVLEFDLTVPEILDGYWQGHLGYWGHSPRQANLGMWFPLVAAYDPELGWLAPPAHWLGEHFALSTADFVVEITVENAPEGLRIAGPGKLAHPDDRTWRFELNDARELALSLSAEFSTISTLTSSGVNVELFYFPDPDDDTLDKPRYALYTAADAMVLYEDLFGPYPHERLVVVQGDFPDGMEFSGLVFVSGKWFETWKHIPNDWLTLITVHEVSHQWWYALVSNDQAQYPYLDEALAIYSELLFLERYYPDQLDWWWEFRVGTYAPAGYVDTPIYDFYSPRSYIDAVYLRGALMVQSLREVMGDDVFFEWLRRYAENMRGRIAYPDDFWGAMPADVYAAVQPVRAGYLKQADILPQGETIP